MALLVVTGPPGAGKSTVAELLATRPDRSVLVEGDAFFGFLRRGAEPPWLPEAREQNDIVVRASAMAAGQFATGGFETVFDGVIGPWFLPTFLEATGLDALHYAVLLPNVETCLTRVHERRDHGFRDADATRKMHREFSRSEIAARHVIANESDARTAAAEIEARFERGELLVRAPVNGSRGSAGGR